MCSVYTVDAVFLFNSAFNNYIPLVIKVYCREVSLCHRCSRPPLVCNLFGEQITAKGDPLFTA